MNIKLKLLILVFITIFLCMYLYFYETKQIKEFFYYRSTIQEYTFKPADKNELMEAIDSMNKSTLRYKPTNYQYWQGAYISDWDVSNITDMSYLFCLEATDSNDQYIYSQETQKFLQTQFGKESDKNHISNWNVSGVRNMSDMFKGAEAFNQPIGNWETAEVINMQNMFMDAYAFNQNLENWNTSKVEDMSWMFFACSVFDQPIRNWDTNKVTDMSYMFAYAKKFNQDINTKHIESPEGNYIAWLTGRVINMSYMFLGAESFDNSISKWNTSAVTNMQSMFEGAISFNKDLKRSDRDNTLANVSVSNNFYSGSSNLTFYRYTRTQDNDNPWHLKGYYAWDTNQVTNMIKMFKGAILFDGDISNWNTAEVTNMTNMFMGAHAFNQMINTWNTGKVTNMSGMFSECTVFDQPIVNWDTSKVTDMSYMFAHAKKFNQDINTKHIESSKGSYIAWLTGRVINMSYMFLGAESFDNSISNWYTGAVTNMQSMFEGAISFNKDLKISLTNSLDFVEISEDFAFSILHPFTYMSGVGRVDFSKYKAWDTGNVQNMSKMFQDAKKFNKDIGNWNTSKVEDMNSMFLNCHEFNKPIDTRLIGTNLQAWDTYLAWDTGNVQNMSKMFQGAKDFNQDIGNWNTSKVEDMNSMFNGSSVFDQKINTKKVDLPDYRNSSKSPSQGSYLAWDTKMVTNMQSMFSNAIEFNSPIGNWNTSKVKDMKYMFASLDWNGTNLCNYAKFNKEIKRKAVTFQGIGADSTDVVYSAWDTSQVDDMQFMFQCTKDFNQDIGNWNTSKVKNMSFMFYGSSNFNQNINDWQTQALINSSEMFNGATEFFKKFIRISSCPGGSFDGPPNCWLGIPITPLDNTTIITAVKSMELDQSSTNFLHFNGVHISEWNTTGVTDMTDLFSAENPTYSENLKNILKSNHFNNIDLSKKIVGNEYKYIAWDTKNVENMTKCFFHSNFNGTISNWCTDKLKNIWLAFAHCPFNGDISTKTISLEDSSYEAWDVSSVEIMTAVFANNSSFNKNISSWDVRNCKNFYSMFYGASSFKQDITNWEVNINILDQTILRIYGVGNATPLFMMFHEATAWNNNFIRISDLSTCNFKDPNHESDGPPGCWRRRMKLVNNMDNIRLNIYTAINLMGKQLEHNDYLKYDFRQISFDNYGNITYDETANHVNGYHISDWDINQITDMSYLFSPVNPNYNRETQLFLRSDKLNDLIAIINASQNWNFSRVTNTSYMFMQAVNFNSDISSWNLSNVTNTQCMFREARSFDQDISIWNIIDQPNQITCDCMFSNSGLSDENRYYARGKLGLNDQDAELIFTDKYLYFYRTNANNNYQSQPVHITRGGNYKIIFANEADTIDFSQYDSYIIIQGTLEKNMYIKITRELDENNDVIDNNDINITSSSTDDRRIIIPKSYKGLIENGIRYSYFNTLINEGFDNVHISNIHMQIDNQDSNDYNESFSAVSRSFYNPSCLQNSFKNCSYVGDTNNSSIVAELSCLFGGEILVEECYMIGNLIGTFSSGIVGSWGNYSNIQIKKCYFTGNLVGISSSGILGSYSGYERDSTILIEDCHTVGNIINEQCSGIVGSFSCYNDSEMNIKGCSFKGNIYFSESELVNYNIDNYNHASQSAGILGSYSVFNNSKCTIDGCQFEGNIRYHEIVNNTAKTYYNSGILGYFSGHNEDNYVGDPSEIIINNCLFVGNISASSSAGICASMCKNVKINDCDFEGNIDGSNWVESIGGIVGNDCRDIEIYGCDFFGDIYGSFNDTGTSGVDYHGGICAYLCRNITIDQCSFKGNIINSTYSGGISGGLYFTGTISNSFSMGQIEGVGCGGIVGANSGSANINFCYFKGDIKGANCGGLLGPICNTYGNEEVNLNISNSFSYCNITGNNSSSLIPSLECQKKNKLINMLTITHCLFSSQLNSNSLYEDGILQNPNLDTLIQKQIISSGIPFTDNPVINITNCALFDQTSETSFDTYAIETIAKNISSVTAMDKWTICYNHWRLSWENTNSEDECNCNYLINKLEDNQNNNISPTIPTVLRDIILKSCTI